MDYDDSNLTAAFIATVVVAVGSAAAGAVGVAAIGIFVAKSVFGVGGGAAAAAPAAASAAATEPVASGAAVVHILSPPPPPTAFAHYNASHFPVPSGDGTHSLTMPTSADVW